MFDREDVMLCRLDAQDRYAMCRGTERESSIVGRHRKLFADALSPQKRARQMDRVKRAELRRHRLRRAIQYDLADFD